ncbi:MAG: lipoyl synthase [Candidatus Omnitrophota bacterium]|nr:MAG: lipoyl synthase [Candidatus Omnitrophota bacterium]
MRKPLWLNKRVDFKKTERMNFLLNDLRLSTICKEAKCPNISDCFSQGVASFLILGRVCTRDCQFCALRKGHAEDIDLEEGKRIAEAVRRLALKYVVITSVSRDDLADGGAEVFANTIREIYKVNREILIEVLTPDFKGEEKAIEKVVRAKPKVFAHNLETVPGLYSVVRKGADYQRSLHLLEQVKKSNREIYTKSGIMLGLGEKEEEVIKVFTDLRKAGCDFLSIGQYLPPSSKHFKVREYVNPGRFLFYKRKAQELGFLYVESGPYVRTSYLAHRYIQSAIGELKD